MPTPTMLAKPVEAPFRAPGAAPPVDLGPVVARVGVARGQRRRMILAVALFAAFASGWLALAVGAGVQDPTSLTPGFVAGLVAMQLFWVFGLGLCMRQLVRTAGSTFSLHAGGIALATRRGTAALAWNEITRFTAQVQRLHSNGLHVATRQTYRYASADGRSITLTQVYDRAAELHATVEAELVRRLLPAATAALESGTPLVFGPFCVTRAGISKRRREVAWVDVLSMQVERGVLVLRCRGTRRLAAAYAEVTNAPILLALWTKVSATT